MMAEQKNRLLMWGLSWDYNPNITNMMLSSNHGMSDKTIVGWDKDAPLRIEWINITISK